MITQRGRDWQAGVMADTASNATGDYAPANWIALSDDTSAEDEQHQVLDGELVGGSFARQQAAFSHTEGSSTYTLISTFTADRTAVVTKYGVFNAASGGDLLFEKLLGTPADVKPGDTVQIVDTVDLNPA